MIESAEDVKGGWDLIIAKDVLEHIPEGRLPGLIDNVVRNLKPDGFFVCGIADFEDEGYHVTLHNKEWWINFFESHKMKFVEDNPQELARSTSFHLKFKLSES